MTLYSDKYDTNDDQTQTPAVVVVPLVNDVLVVIGTTRKIKHHKLFTDSNHQRNFFVLLHPYIAEFSQQLCFSKLILGQSYKYHSHKLSLDPTFLAQLLNNNVSKTDHPVLFHSYGYDNDPTDAFFQNKIISTLKTPMSRAINIELSTIPTPSSMAASTGSTMLYLLIFKSQRRTTSQHIFPFSKIVLSLSSLSSKSRARNAVFIPTFCCRKFRLGFRGSSCCSA